ncbi:MAG: hypothetical protein AAF664_05030 [Planctomycetota bacterium]
MRLKLRNPFGLLCAGLISVTVPCVEADAQRRGISSFGRAGVGQTMHQRAPTRPQTVPSRGRSPRRPTPTFPTFRGPTDKPTMGHFGRVPMNLQGTQGTARGQAPKPKDPPKDWRDFTLGHKKPPIRPKSQTNQGSRLPMNLQGTQGTARGQAPKPKDPPKDWRDFTLGHEKPPIRPKSQTSQGSRLPMNLGSRPTQSRPRPTHGGDIDDILPPYVHPPRHVVGFPPPRK